MKYFTYELIAASNEWIDQTKEARLDADLQSSKTEKQYQSSLVKLKPRIGKQAWSFFEHGNPRLGLHDGRLVSLSIGDGLDYRPDGTKPFRVNRRTTSAQVVFLNYEQDLLYTFDLRGVSRLSSDLLRSEMSIGLGDLYTYEIVTVDKDLLQVGFLFASGATIIAQFTKLVFRKQRIRRKYPPGEMYR